MLLMEDKPKPRWVHFVESWAGVDAWIRGMLLTLVILGYLAWGIFKGGVGVWFLLALTCVFVVGVIMLIKPWDDAE